MGSAAKDYATSLYPQTLALISLTSGGGSVGILRSRTHMMVNVEQLIFFNTILFAICTITFSKLCKNMYTVACKSAH
jgi:hypothetical protein